MRAVFAKTLTELATADSRILLLTGDLGYMALEPFVERFPDRFFNMGVAEQNMVGVATGLAEAGYIPFVYSIVNFSVLRPYEFIRNGPILHQFPVRIVGMGGGLEYGHNGPSHHGLEDVGVMRLQPGMTVIAPADKQQAQTALLSTWDLPGPVYYRLGKNDKVVVPGLEGKFSLGRAEIVGEGKDLLLISMGSQSVEAAAVLPVLAKLGISASLMVVASLNPPPRQDLIDLLPLYRTLMSVEAHYVTGGVGSLVAEIIAENKLNCKLVSCAIRKTPDGISGSEEYLCRRYGISRDALVEAALKVLDYPVNSLTCYEKA